RARRRARRRRCACSRSTPLRGCPSAARCWRPTSPTAHEQRPAAGSPPPRDRAGRPRRRARYGGPPARGRGQPGLGGGGARGGGEVEGGWWRGKPVRRRYFELVLTDGRNMVVFLDLGTGRWFMQRA